MQRSTARSLFARLLSLFSDERGQGVVEYGLILGLIAMVAIGALLTLGGGLSNSLGSASHGLTPNPSTSLDSQGGVDAR